MNRATALAVIARAVVAALRSGVPAQDVLDRVRQTIEAEARAV